MRLKWTKSFSFLTILYESLHMVLGSGGSDKTGWKQVLLIFSSPLNIPLPSPCLGEVEAVRRGLKEIKSQTRTILETHQVQSSLKKKKMIMYE